MKALGSITANPQRVATRDPSGLGVTEISWTAEHTEAVEVRVDSPQGPLFAGGGATGRVRTGTWIRYGIVFYLQDVSKGKPLSTAHTLATVVVTVEASPSPVPRLAAAGNLHHRRAGPKAVILAYHRVAKLKTDPWSLSVSPQHFAEHLEALCRQAQVIPLGRLVCNPSFNSLPHHAVLVTFDDGYADNLYNAKPLLEACAVPATFFLVSSFVGGETEFWWDELENLLLQSSSLPSEFELQINGSTYHWELAERDLAGTAVHREEARRNEGQRPVFGSSLDATRQGLYRSLHGLLRALPDEKRCEVMHQLFTWAGFESTLRSSHRPLTEEEAVELAQGKLVEIGAHTVTHPLLPALPASSQRTEVARSKILLEESLGTSVRHFSYPYGSFAEETIEIAKDSGFVSACTTAEGIVDRSTDPFRLPRFTVHDWDGEEFSEHLSRWFELSEAELQLSGGTKT